MQMDGGDGTQYCECVYVELYAQMLSFMCILLHFKKFL
jgi:hypothetical protein